MMKSFRTSGFKCLRVRLSDLRVLGFKGRKVVRFKGFRLVTVTLCSRNCNSLGQALTLTLSLNQTLTLI